MCFCEAQNLLDLRAVKFGIMSVPSIGCCPYQRSLNDTGGCMEGLNACAQVFHEELEGLLQNLSSEYPAMHYSLANSYEMTQTILTALSDLVSFRPLNKSENYQTDGVHIWCESSYEAYLLEQIDGPYKRLFHICYSIKSWLTINQTSKLLEIRIQTHLLIDSLHTTFI